LFFIVAAIVIVVIGLWFLGRPAVIESSSSTPGSGSVTGSELVLDAGSALPELVVHVAGSVKNPGLYRLPIGARVAEAIEAAGGVSKKNAANSVNLAREVVDGEQILVGQNATGGAGGGISINSSTASELEDLPGVGPVIAARIVSYREANGPFTSIDALGEVSGIGDSILGSVRDIATL
jgi:competence protein ComEA